MSKIANFLNMPLWELCLLIVLAVVGLIAYIIYKSMYNSPEKQAKRREKIEAEAKAYRESQDK